MSVTTTLDRPLRPDELLEEASGVEAGRSAATLVSRPDVRVALTALRAGSGIAEHKAPGAVVITCVKGHVVFTADGGSIDLEQGGAIAFRPEALHSVHAPTDSAILITIAGAERPSAS